MNLGELKNNIQIRRGILQKQRQRKIFNLTTESKQQIKNEIINQSKLMNQISYRQAKTMNRRQYTNEKLRNMVSQIKSYNRSSLVTRQTLSLSDYRKLSVIPIITRIVSQKMVNMIDIQTEIDPIKKQLVRLPKTGKSIMSIVSQIVSLPDIVTQYDKILYYSFQSMQEVEQIQQVKNELIRPILQKSYQTMKFLSYHINIQQLMKCLFNKNVKCPIQASQITTLQSNQLEKIRKQNEKYYSSQQLNKEVKSYLIKMIRRKRTNNIDKGQFFSLVKQSQLLDFQQIIRISVQSQIKALTQIKPVVPPPPNQ